METKSVLCFRSDRKGGGQQTTPEETVEERREEQKPIFCGACGVAITGKDQGLAVAGAHAHAFFNPAGIAFEIGCFKSAPGCVVTGTATDEFTWFAGYLWRFASCRQCKAHLGWFYEKAEHAFFGLILTSLSE